MDGKHISFSSFFMFNELFIFKRKHKKKFNRIRGGNGITFCTAIIRTNFITLKRILSISICTNVKYKWNYIRDESLKVNCSSKENRIKKK